MISMVLAMSENNCIGKDGKLPWHLPEDMLHFKNVTMGKVVIMGRKTWESIPKKFRPLPGRKNVIISRNPDYDAPDVVDVFTSLEVAIAAYKDNDIAIIGGGQIYTLGMPHADVLEVTHVRQHVDGDTFFPPIDPAVWQLKEQHEQDDLIFATYTKVL